MNLVCCVGSRVVGSAARCSTRLWSVQYNASRVAIHVMSPAIYSAATVARQELLLSTSTSIHLDRQLTSGTDDSPVARDFACTFPAGTTDNLTFLPVPGHCPFNLQMSGCTIALLSNVPLALSSIAEELRRRAQVV